jgi:hypothetical protein
MRATQIQRAGYRAGRIFGFMVLTTVFCGGLGGALAQRPEPAPAEAPVAARAEAKSDGIVRGTVVAAESERIVVRDEDGTERSLKVAPTTLVISDAEDFSIANMPEIQLEVADLQTGDEVEVVLEPAANELRAGIVTKMLLFEPALTAGRRP